MGCCRFRFVLRGLPIVALVLIFASFVLSLASLWTWRWATILYPDTCLCNRREGTDYGPIWISSWMRNNTGSLLSISNSRVSSTNADLRYPLYSVWWLITSTACLTAISVAVLIWVGMSVVWEESEQSMGSVEQNAVHLPSSAKRILVGTSYFLWVTWISSIAPWSAFLVFVSDNFSGDVSFEFVHGFRQSVAACACALVAAICFSVACVRRLANPNWKRVVLSHVLLAFSIGTMALSIAARVASIWVIVAFRRPEKPVGNGSLYGFYRFSLDSAGSSEHFPSGTAPRAIDGGITTFVQSLWLLFSLDNEGRIELGMKTIIQCLHSGAVLTTSMACVASFSTVIGGWFLYSNVVHFPQQPPIRMGKLQRILIVCWFCFMVALSSTPWATVLGAFSHRSNLEGIYKSDLQGNSLVLKLKTGMVFSIASSTCAFLALTAVIALVWLEWRETKNSVAPDLQLKQQGSSTISQTKFLVSEILAIFLLVVTMALSASSRGTLIWMTAQPSQLMFGPSYVCQRPSNTTSFGFSPSTALCVSVEYAWLYLTQDEIPTDDPIYRLHKCLFVGGAMGITTASLAAAVLLLFFTSRWPETLRLESQSKQKIFSCFLIVLTWLLVATSMTSWGLILGGVNANINAQAALLPRALTSNYQSNSWFLHKYFSFYVDPKRPVQTLDMNSGFIQSVTASVCALLAAIIFTLVATRVRRFHLPAKAVKTVESAHRLVASHSGISDAPLQLQPPVDPWLAAVENGL